MLNTILTLILLQIIVVNLIDLSGFVDSIKRLLWKKFIKVGKYDGSKFNLKPWDCSYCMTHHTLLLYLIITGQFTIPLYTIVLLLSFLTPVIGDFMMFIKDLLTDIITGLYKLFNL